MAEIQMQAYLLVALGGAAGSVARFWLSGAVATKAGETFPWGTLAVNVSGSFVIGLLAALNLPEGRFFISTSARQLLMIGLCGGYTTFSSFSLQTLTLIQNREWLHAGGNVVLSTVLCLAATWLGFVLGAALNSKGA